MSPSENESHRPESQEDQLRYLIFGLNEDAQTIVDCLKAHFDRFPFDGKTDYPSSMRLPEPLESELRSLVEQGRHPDVILQHLEAFFGQRQKSMLSPIPGTGKDGETIKDTRYRLDRRLNDSFSD